MTIEALDAGKHVYCAVPISQSIEEIEAIVERVETSRLIYMTGETSYYNPSTVYCRKRFAVGDFGEFVYGEGQYLHDMVDFYELLSIFRRERLDASRRHPSDVLPDPLDQHGPLRHRRARHARLLSGTESTITRTGYSERAPIFGTTFSAIESALMRTSDGGVLRVNEFRRIGWHGLASVQLSLFGTKSCFEEQANSQVWSNLENLEVLDLTDTLRVHGRRNRS